MSKFENVDIFSQNSIEINKVVEQVRICVIENDPGYVDPGYLPHLNFKLCIFL